MMAAGGTVVKNYRDLAFMGFIEVIKNLPSILKNLKFCKEDILSYKPDVLILIDYPGFNLRIAKWAKEQGFKVVYYISPQVWAWKEKRVELIREVVDKMLVILPFEEAFYQKWNYQVTYLGHPLVQVVESAATEGGQLATNRPAADNDGKEIIALLPGSRKQEVSVKLPLVLQTTRRFPQYRFVIAQAPSLPVDFYRPFIDPYPNVEIAFAGQTYTLLARAKAALVTSGTATLETALFGVPQVVCYKGSAVSYAIARRLVKIKYISLVNLIMNKPVVAELIQHSLTVENIERELNEILHNAQRIGQIKADYAALKSLLQKEGNASARAAAEIVALITATASASA